MKRIVAIAIVLALALACGCTPQHSNSSDDPIAVPTNFRIDFDSSTLSVPKTASVINANRIIFEDDATVSVLMQNEYDRSAEGIGTVFRASTDDVFECLYLDRDGYGTDTRELLGMITYYRRPASLSDQHILPVRIKSFLAPSTPIGRRLAADEFSADEDFDDLSASEARAYTENTLTELGIPGESIRNTKTLRVGTPDQISYIDNVLSDEVRAGFRGSQKELLSNAYVLEYRQFFDGIPVNITNWHLGIDSAASGMAAIEAKMQEITAAVYADGNFSLDLRNLFTVESVSEASDIISYDEALEKLLAVFSDTLLLTETHLVSAELCYCIFETDVKNECILYPLWLFSVTDSRISTQDDSESPYNGLATYGAVYAFDAFSGERIVDIGMPSLGQ